MFDFWVKVVYFCGEIFCFWFYLYLYFVISMYNESKMLFFQENTTKKQEYQKSKKLLFTIKSKKITKIHIYIYILPHTKIRTIIYNS